MGEGDRPAAVNLLQLAQAAPGDNGIDVTVAIVGATGIILGAALTAGLQVIGLRIQRGHDLEDRRLDRKRRMYEEYLRFVFGLDDEIDKAVRTLDEASLRRTVSEQMRELAVGVRLDASSEVRHRVSDVQTSIATYFTRGADAMAEELRSR